MLYLQPSDWGYTFSNYTRSLKLTCEINSSNPASQAVMRGRDPPVKLQKVLRIWMGFKLRIASTMSLHLSLGQKWRRWMLVYLICLCYRDIHDVCQWAVGATVENVDKYSHHQPRPNSHPSPTTDKEYMEKSLVMFQLWRCYLKVDL
jgi:hypothetical protein